MPEIILGSPSQIQAVERAHALWTLVQSDKRFTFQGRSVSLAGEQPGAENLVIALSRLLGYASCHFVQKQNAQAFQDAFEAAGLAPATWNQYWGRDSALSKSAAFLRDFEPPEGLTLKTVTKETPDDTIRAICEMSLSASVLPAPASTMRGEGPRSVFSYVETDQGDIVAAGGSCMAYHPESARADEAFWGMLATHSAWRGKRLACWVGAQIIQDMAEKHGARGFSSGVKSDNPASQAMCSRLGVEPSEYVYAGATNPDAFGGGSITR